MNSGPDTQMKGEIATNRIGIVNASVEEEHLGDIDEQSKVGKINHR